MSRGEPSLLHRAPVRQLIVVCLLAFTSFCLTLASLPSWSVQGGARQATAGLVTTTMLVSTVVFQGLVSVAIKGLGMGRALALGLILLGAPAPIYALGTDLRVMLPVSAVRGAGFALLTVVGATLTTVVAPRHRHGETVGLYGLSVAIPNLVGIPGGVALTEAGHFRWVAWLAVCPVLAVPWALRLGTARAEPDPTADATAAPADWRAGAIAALPASIILLSLTAAGGALVTFLPIQRPSGSLATIALLAFAAASTLARWRAGVMIDRRGPRILLPVAILCGVAGVGGVGLCLVGGSAYDAALVVAAFSLGMGYGAVQNLTLVIAFARAGATGADAASALWNACFETGTAIGAFGLGALAATGLGVPWSYVAAGGVVLAGLPIALRMRSGAPAMLGP